MPAEVSVVVISKDEPALGATLEALRPEVWAVGAELIVVDASGGRLDRVRAARPEVVWVDFAGVDDVAVTIPHQRNAGVRLAQGRVIVFTDCGCIPRPGWLRKLIAPIVAGDEVATCGPALTKAPSAYTPREPPSGYVSECPTINLALARQVLDSVGGFDETFAYGSDIDLTWRLADIGAPIRWVDDAVVVHDAGSWRRQAKRAFMYGAARGRLYRKHRERLRTVLRDDPVPVLYPLFILGLPLAVRWRWYLALVLVPLWRNRHDNRPALAVADHLLQGAGTLAELIGAA